MYPGYRKMRDNPTERLRWPQRGSVPVFRRCRPRFLHVLRRESASSV